jgi:WD40 repeat protein
MRSIAIVALALMLAGTSGKLQAQEPPLPVEIVRVAGHSQEITTLAFSADGKTLATGSHDYTVRLWNVATGLLLRSIGGPTFAIEGLAFSGDGTEVLFVSDPLSRIDVNVSDAATGKLKRRVANPILDVATMASSATFSPDGSVVALVAFRTSGGYTVELVDTRTGASLHSISRPRDSDLAFSPDGRYLAATDEDCALVLLDPGSGEEVSELGCGSLFGIFGSAPKLDAYAFARDGRTIAAAAGSTLMQFDVASGDLLSEVDTGGTIVALGVSPDGSMMATASYGGDIEIRDATGKSLRTAEGPERSRVKVLAFSPDGGVLASGDGDGLVRLWDAKNWSSARSLQGAKYEIGGVAVTADGAKIASDGSGSTVLWDAREGRLERKMLEKEETTYGCKNCSIGFSPDDHLLAAGTRRATTIFWDVASGKVLQSLEHSTKDAVSGHRWVTFLPSGNALLLGAVTEGREPDTKESSPVIWDPVARKVLHVLASEPHTDGVIQWEYPIAISPDGRLIASAGRDNVINLFDSQSGQLVRSVRARSIASNALAFSADGRILASATGDFPTDHIEMWDVATGSLVRTIEVPTRGILSLAFSPDNRTLASAGDDKIISLWNQDNGTQIGSLRGHDASVSSLVFTKEGTLLSGSHDGSVKIWRAGSFDLLATMAWQPSSEWIVFTPEGFFEAEGRTRLAIVRGIEAYPIDAAYDLLHRPDLVREKLKGDPQGLVKAAAAELDLWKVVAPH